PPESSTPSAKFTDTAVKEDVLNLELGKIHTTDVPSASISATLISEAAWPGRSRAVSSRADSPERSRLKPPRKAYPSSAGFPPATDVISCPEWAPPLKGSH